MNAITYYFPEQADLIFAGLIIVGVVLAAVMGVRVVRDWLASEEGEGWE